MQIPVGKCLMVAMVALLAPATMAGAADAPGIDEAIKADPEVQALLERHASTPRWTPEFYQQLIALRQIATREPAKQRRRDPKSLAGPPVSESERHLIRQAAFFSAQAEPTRETPEGLVQVGANRGKLKELMRDLYIPEYRVMSALLPYLDTKDQKLRDFIRTDVLEGDGQNDAFETNRNDPVLKGMLQYLMYEVDVRNLDGPTSFVQILYWKAPSTAIHYLPKPSQRNRTELYPVVRVVEEVLWKKSHNALKAGDNKPAIAALDKLSQFDDWAVKLYVAEMLRRHQQFRDPKIIERLRSDKNPVVAKAVDVPYREEEKEEKRGFFGL